MCVCVYLLEGAARRVECGERRVGQLRADAAAAQHPAQRERLHLERDRQAARVEARAGDEGVAKLGGEGRVEPDRRRVRVQRLLARRDG